MSISKTVLFASFLFFALFSVSAHAADCSNGGRYENNSDGTATDCRTGLIWLLNANCNEVINGVNGGPPIGWSPAHKWTSGLADGLCGLFDGSSAGDWRLPTKTEFMAMITYAKNHGMTDPTLTNGAGTGHWTTLDVFTFVQSDNYWTSTNASNATDVWIINMFNGALYSIPKIYGSYVWPVRGGQSGSVGSLFVE